MFSFLWLRTQKNVLPESGKTKGCESDPAEPDRGGVPHLSLKLYHGLMFLST